MFPVHSHRMQWSLWSYEGFKDITVLLWGNQTWFSMLFQCCFNACATFSKENCQELKTRVDRSGKELLWFGQRMFSYFFFYHHKSKLLTDVAFIREINRLYMGVTFTTINHCSNTSVHTFYSKRVSKTPSWFFFPEFSPLQDIKCLYSVIYS